jgi:hypothetical protein
MATALVKFALQDVRERRARYTRKTWAMVWEDGRVMVWVMVWEDGWVMVWKASG